MKKTISIIAGILLTAAGLYLLAISKPELVYRPKSDTQQIAQETTRELQANRVYIPTLSRTFDYNTGDVDTLTYGGWHRYPERGEPGYGNFIIAAHRYRAALSPWETIEESPLFYVDRLELDDEIFITDENGELYTYKITEINRVDPHATEIEAPSNEHVLTMYTCTREGASDGRVVVRAVLQG